MQKRTARRSHRPLKPEVEERLSRARKEAERDREPIEETAREAKADHDAVLWEIRQAISSLRAERAAQNLSLAEVKERSGFSRSSLCRLENDLEPNPTVST
jgi:AraC-like DNA-binding protein